MDPLSISASIAALLQLTGTVISYLSNVKDGPRELKSLRSEITSVLSVLFSLQDQADQATNSTLKSLNVPSGAFHECQTTLDLLGRYFCGAFFSGFRSCRGRATEFIVYYTVYLRVEMLTSYSRSFEISSSGGLEEDR